MELTGHAHIPDEINVAFLETDDDIAKETIERAVDGFIRDEMWPPLPYRECLHLSLRTSAARAVIRDALGATPTSAANQMIIERSVPDLDDRDYAFRWFLVVLWNAFGKIFLVKMADDWLKTRGQGIEQTARRFAITG